MVSKVTSISLPQVFTKALPLSKVKMVALMALAVFTMVLLAVVKRSLSGRAMPGTPSNPSNLPQLPPPVMCKYHVNLIEVLGGQEAFDQVPTLEAEKTTLYYLKQDSIPELRILPHQMPNDYMKGEDSLHRSFFAVKYVNRQTLEIKVNVWLCRDSGQNRWYYNDEKSPEEWSMGKDHSLFFLRSLLKNNHTRYELPSVWKVSCEKPVVTSTASPKSPISEIDIPSSEYLDPLIVDMGGSKKFDQYPVTYLAKSKREDEVNRSDKLEAIQKMCRRVRITTPINKGRDEWGCPFVRVDYLSKSGRSQVIYIYCNIEDKKRVWYIENGRYEDAVANKFLLQQLVNRSHPACRLVD